MKSKKKFWAVVLILGIIFNFSPTTTFAVDLPGDISWYTGDESSYLLEDAADLFGLAALVNSGTEDFESVTITVYSDISITDYVYEGVPCSWTPIGTDNHPFKGNFEGGNKTISNLNGGGSDYQGLFGYIGDAAVRNITVTGSVYGGDYVGGVVGYAVGSALNNVTASVNVDGAGDYIGGLIGFAEDTDLVQVKATGGSVEGGSYVGGIAGSLTDSSSLTDSYATVTVDAGDYAGGLAGNVDDTSTLSDSFYYNSGGVTSGGSHVGGAAGAGSVGNSYYLDTAAPDTASGAARNADSFGHGEVLYLLTQDDPDPTLWEQGTDYPVWGSGTRLYRVGIDGTRPAGSSVDIAGSNVFNAGGARQWVYVPDTTPVTLNVYCDTGYNLEFYPPLSSDGGDTWQRIYRYRR